MLPLLATYALAQADAPPRGFHLVREADVVSYALKPMELRKVLCVVRKSGTEVRFDLFDRNVPVKAISRPEPQRAKVVLPGGTLSYFNENNSTKVDDGWIATVSDGERGGGIYHFSKDWKKLTKIFDGNSGPVYRMADGLYAFGGLSRPGYTWGRLVKIERRDGRWMAFQIKAFDHEMTPAVKDDDQNFLVFDTDQEDGDATGRQSVASIGLNGKGRSVCSFANNCGRPTSITRGADGAVYVGIEKFLLKITRDGKRPWPKATWFEPDAHREVVVLPTNVKVPTGFHRVSEADFIASDPLSGGSFDFRKPRKDVYVRRDGDQLRFSSPRTMTDEEMSKYRDEVKATVKVEGGAGGSFTEKNTIAVEDGWLGTLDVGEWGGGIYWFSKDWKERKQLYDDNSTDIIRLSGKLYVLTGFDYARQDSGVLHRIERGKNGWATVKVAPVGRSIDVIAKFDEKHLLVVQEHLKLMGLDGRRELLCRLPRPAAYPTSMGVASDGAIYIGYRGYLLGIAKRGKEYVRNWFEPDAPAEPTDKMPLTVNSRPTYGLSANLRPRPFQSVARH